MKNEPLEVILERQPYLSDLHTHLLGMGNAGFWIDSIIEKPYILPTHMDFCSKPTLREQLCPLIWNAHRDKDLRGFIDGKRTTKFFELLIERNFPKDLCIDVPSIAANGHAADMAAFIGLICNQEFINKLEHYDLSFGNEQQMKKTRTSKGPVSQKIWGDFTYDVVLTLSNLKDGLGITIPWIVEFEDLIQSKVEEKLGLHIYPLPKNLPARPFRRWIIFNAREQIFEIVKGITVEVLRKLIDVKANAPLQSSTLARAHIQNAFSMCNPDGTVPRPIDFDKFHGSFTPEFYPRRFALKDSLYSQRLDILAALLVHILQRYQTCMPPIKYCELSIGVGDLCRPWVFDVLCSFPAHTPIIGQKLNPGSFRRIMMDNGHFAYLRNAYPIPGKLPLPCTVNVVYKFLAGFNRKDVTIDGIKDQMDALRLLNESPDVAIKYILEEIVQSEKSEKDKKKRSKIKNSVQVNIISIDRMLQNSVLKFSRKGSDEQYVFTRTPSLFLAKLMGEIYRNTPDLSFI